MGDLISRQAAIDALAEELYHNEDDYRTAVSVIGGLPSAQPERKKGKWIPVTERMPEPDDIVVVCTNGGQMYVWSAMPNRGDDYCWEDDYGYCHNKWEVMAWMPMPEPWKEEQESLEDYCSGDCDYCPWRRYVQGTDERIDREPAAYCGLFDRWGEGY